MALYMRSGALTTLIWYLNKAISQYVIYIQCHYLQYVYQCLQATGDGYVSGTFMIFLGNEQFQFKFKYSVGGKPTFDSKKLTSGSDTIEILDGPTVEGFTAHVSFKISRSSKSNNDFNNISSDLTFLYL